MFVYVMRNPSMPGLYKIGRSGDPARRAAELSAVTGVPTPFEIVASVKCFPAEHSEKVEAIAHLMLSSYHVNVRREFFELGHESMAVRAILIAEFAAKGYVTDSEVLALRDDLAKWPLP